MLFNLYFDPQQKYREGSIGIEPGIKGNLRISTVQRAHSGYHQFSWLSFVALHGLAHTHINQGLSWQK